MLDAHQHSPIRVTHVVLSLDVGGLERIVLNLLREGRALGQHVSVLCIERFGELAPLVREMGVTIACAHKPPGKRPGLAAKIAPILRELAPDVIHTHQITPLFYVGRAARQLGDRAPVIVHTEHGKNYSRRLRSRLLGRWASRYASRFFCVSSDIADEVLACRVAPASKVAVAENGIDPQPFARRHDQRETLRRSLGIASDAPVIGTVGRLSEIKQQDVLIRSFAIARRSDPRLQLVLVGDGPKAEELQQLAERLNLRDAVHFAGYQPQPEKYYQIMDAFALTSRSEGMPLAVLEAWASGLGVVSSRVGGIPELIEHGVNGLLFEDRDERGLATMLVSLTREPTRAARLGRAGRKRVCDAYHIRRTAAEYNRNYHNLLSAGPRHVDLPSLAAVSS